MANGNNEEKNEPLRKVVDSTIAIAFARFFMPAALAVIGWLLTTGFQDLKSSNDRLWSAVAKLTDITHTTISDVAVLKTKTDDLSKNVDRITDKIDKMSVKP